MLHLSIKKILFKDEDLLPLSLTAIKRLEKLTQLIKKFLQKQLTILNN